MSHITRKFDATREYFFREGCFINELSNSENDRAVSIARVRLEPGKITRWHCLKNITERYVILEGQGQAEVGHNSPEQVTAGDVVIIPPNMRQRIQNTGSVDLIFLAICSPRFQERYYYEPSEEDLNADT